MTTDTCTAACCAPTGTPPRPGIPDELRPLIEPIDTLTPYHRNPRRGDTTVIAASLTRNGQYRPIVANTGALTGRHREILAGNHTAAAARELGWVHVAATWVDVDNDHAARVVAVDNRSNDIAGYDDEALLALLASLPDLDGTGYDEDFLRELADTVNEPYAGGLTDPDDVPDPPAAEDAVTWPGDVWVLGDHRLICGDSTDKAVWTALLGDERAQCVWTDPPYGVSYVGKTADALTIQNDSLTPEQLRALLDAAFGHALAFGPGAAWYVAAPAGPLHLVFANLLRELGVYRQQLIWVKDHFVLGRSDYHYRHEPLFYGYAPGVEGRRGRGGDGWHGDHAQDSVWEIPRPSRSEDHPTMKPVALVERALGNSTGRGHVVVDMFGGSGTTLLAAEMTGRLARLIELDPVYCDVIARRWQEHTGRTPVLQREGQPDTPVDMTTGQPATAGAS